MRELEPKCLFDCHALLHALDIFSLEIDKNLLLPAELAREEQKGLGSTHLPFSCINLTIKQFI
jgi:hypothetical protein